MTTLGFEVARLPHVVPEVAVAANTLNVTLADITASKYFEECQQKAKSLKLKVCPETRPLHCVHARAARPARLFCWAAYFIQRSRQ
jgi:hypothetical protein